jgi:D-sedoheptulose 7-phosphate isomerase
VPNDNLTTLNRRTFTRPITESQDYFGQLSLVLASMPHAKVEQVADKLFDAWLQGDKVFVFGNGGSAALASHFATDLGKGTTSHSSSLRMKVMSLTDNVPLMTAWANDTSYDQVFAEQLRNFAEAGDIAFAISGSGNSPNVIEGLQAARAAGAFTIGLGGFQGGKMKSLCDLCIVIPSDNMQIIEDLHTSISHAVYTLLCTRMQQAQATTPTAVAAGRR